MMRAAALSLVFASAPALVASENSCPSGGECVDDSSALLSTRIKSHKALSAENRSTEGRCCYGLRTCPKNLDADGYVWGCYPASHRCSESAGMCSKPCCHKGLKGKYCPVTDSSTCALGRNVRVVTDMGFDDWGAFSILNAAGCTPQRALGVSGMMPSDFAADFAGLLSSWGLSTKVYEGPKEPNTCWNPAGHPAYRPCKVKATDIGWLSDYRNGLLDQLPQSMGPHPENRDLYKGFWDCAKGEEYTLLVISPQSAVADQLNRDPLTSKKCIKRIVFMGGLFENLQLNWTDPSTWGNVMGPLQNVSNTSVPKHNTELNVLSDVPAAAKVWGDSVELPMRIFSLETASVARSGVQRIFLEGKTAGYLDDEQYSEEKLALQRLKMAAGCGKRSQETMLEGMVCLKSGADQATLDLDAIAASSIWIGDSDTFMRFNFKASKVTVDKETGVTTRENSSSSKVRVATTFDSLTWYEKLMGLLEK